MKTSDTGQNELQIKAATLSRVQAAHYLNMGVSTLDRLKIPRINYGKTIRYLTDDLDKYIIQHRKDTKNVKR
jgi:hypothetical protein